MTTSWQRQRLLGASVGVLAALLAIPAAVATEPDISPAPAVLRGGDVPTVAGGSADGVLASPDASLAGYSRFSPTPVVLAESTPWSDIVIDLDGDGYDEIVYGYGSAVTIMRGSSTGIQGIEEHYLDESGEHPIAVGDYNSDGYLDVAAGYSQDPLFAIFYGKAGGGFEDRVDFPVARSISVASVDINRDGRDDLAVRDSDRPRLQFYVQQDDGSLQRSVAYPNAPEIRDYLWFEPGDFNGDGLVDFLAWTQDFDAGYAAFIMQAAPGSWMAPEIIPTFGPVDRTPTDLYPSFVFVDDMDSDGDDDVLINGYPTATDGSRQAMIFWQDGKTPNLEPDPLGYPCEAASQVTDIDGNGLLDVVCDRVPSVPLVMQYAPQRFYVENYVVKDHNSSPVVGNFIGDDLPDLVVRDYPYVHTFEGISEGYATGNPGVVIGTASLRNSSVAPVGLCVTALALVDGSVGAEDVVGNDGRFELSLLPGTYYLRTGDCRISPRDPAGYSYSAKIVSWDPDGLIFLGPGDRLEGDVSVTLEADRTGDVVDDVSQQPLEGIYVASVQWDEAAAWYWVVAEDVTSGDGSFVLPGPKGIYRLLFLDPVGIYPPHLGDVSTYEPYIGVWGLTDPIVRDIRDSAFVSDILWLRDEGVTRGCSSPANDMYCPDDYVTRGQMAAFLNRFLHLPASAGGDFVDDDGSIFEADIERLAAAGITKGCNPPANSMFCPDKFVTRGQMAAFLVRALALPDGAEGAFVDDDNSVFEVDIERLAASGITKGCNPPLNDHYCPNRYVTREQMAAFLHRADGYR